MSASGSEQRISMLEELRAAVSSQLPGYLSKQRWFGGKARRIQSSKLLDFVPFRQGALDTFFLLARVEYETGPGETYVLPMLCNSEEVSAEDDNRGRALMIENSEHGTHLTLTEALEHPEFLAGLLKAIEENSALPGCEGEIRSHRTRELERLHAPYGGSLTPKVLKGEQSNSSIVFGEKLILKIFRRVDAGMNPDLEIGLFLTGKARFKNIPPVAGSLEYRTKSEQAATIGMLQGFVPNRGDAWRFTLEHLAAFWQEVSKLSDASEASVDPTPLASPNAELESLTEGTNPRIPSLPPYMAAVALLGKRTAQMHQALASDSSDPAFAPEPYSSQFQASMERSITELIDRNFGLLRQKENDYPEEVRSHAEHLIAKEANILEMVRSTLRRPITGMRMRIHGDYHLGQVLYTGSDFMIIDFEGEPARSLADRRLKRSALQDVAGMLRSFHYAAFASKMNPSPGTKRPDGHPDPLNRWAQRWANWANSCFLNSYLEQSGEAIYLPSDRDQLSDLLQLLVLEKAIYELGYELNSRPSWVGIPLAGISALLNS